MEEPAASVTPEQIAAGDEVLPPADVPACLLLRTAHAAGHHPAANQTTQAFLKKLTHLHLNDQNPCGHLSSSICQCCPRASVIYLYSNKLTSAGALNGLKHLTSLYLQVRNQACWAAAKINPFKAAQLIEHLLVSFNTAHGSLRAHRPVPPMQDNWITDASALGALTSVRALYLDSNAIQHIHGLAALTNLQELHLSRQRLPGGSPLQFERSTIEGLAQGLTKLCVTHCQLDSCAQLAGLRALRSADLSSNALTSVDSVAPLLQGCPQLRDLSLGGNPVTHVTKYQDQVRPWHSVITTNASSYRHLSSRHMDCAGLHIGPTHF